MKKRISCFVVFGFLPFFLRAVTLEAPCGRIVLSDEDGSILSVVPSGASSSVWRSGKKGLWSVAYEDKTEEDASSYRVSDPDRSFRVRQDVTGEVELVYTSTNLRMRVSVKGGPEGFDFRAVASPATKTMLTLALPAELRFTPEQVSRFVFPQNGNTGLGIACNASFFREQPDDHSLIWKCSSRGDAGYSRLYSGGLHARAVSDPPVSLRVTEEGRRWFSAALAAKIDHAGAVANRTPAKGQADVTLIESVNGAYLSASRMGGTGALWRVGGLVRDADAVLVSEAVGEVVEKLAKTREKSRPHIGLLAVRCGPDRGVWAAVRLKTWEAILRRTAQAAGGELTLFTRPEDVLRALTARDFVCLLNPYGEAVPVNSAVPYDTLLAAIRRYVVSGGNWLEVGGYSFHQQLSPQRYLSYRSPYPPAFADFFHLDARGGSAAVYRIQPRVRKDPWEAAQDTEKIFIPGALSCGGDEEGGFCTREFAVFVKPGVSRRMPVVRIALGGSPEENLTAYAKANGLTRPLAEKIRPEILARLREAPLLKLNGTCAAMTASLAEIPAPALIHFSDFLKGGFDKEYPDHLPVNRRFGTMDELRTFFREARSKGHLISPYTNPTWWCDHPKGPSFAAAGDAPLLRNPDGTAKHEQYAKNDGWTVTFWHPAVQKANRKTVREFTRDFPVDLLFQDQCGARSWLYDLNPASPAPCAYTEGLLSMNDEDSRVAPLGTENGWDRVANFQTMLCGLSWGEVPTPGRAEWMSYFKEEYPASTWSIYPLALFLMHDKCLFTHHDLGQFIEEKRYDTLVWTLATGYGLSFTCSAEGYRKTTRGKQWYAWLSRLQKVVCSRYMGAPLVSFTHDRKPMLRRNILPEDIRDDGIIRAKYGEVTVLANLGDVPREIDGHRLAPYGFFLEETGRMTAEYLEGQSPVIREFCGGKTNEWRYLP